ncbi:MAG: flavodoxin [Treponema sp.]|nr:flavodoxin [Candidatus Treponema scatequi]
MKKAILSILLGGLIMTSTYAKTAVVYFSCTGNTERLAKTTAKALDADLFEIIPEQAYTDADLNWNDKKSRSTIECNDPKSRPAIKSVKSVSGEVFDAKKYDIVVLAYPIWWAYAPKIIYTFVEGTDLSGKKVVPICTSGGSGIGNSGTDLAKKCGKGDWRKGSLFRASASEDEVKKFFETALK